MTCVHVFFPIVNKKKYTKFVFFIAEQLYLHVIIHRELHSVLTITILTATTEINQINYPGNKPK